MTRYWRRALALLALAGLWACSTPVSTLAPGERPSLDSSEAGLWLQADRAEAGLRRSRSLISDPNLNAYVSNLVCRLADAHCNDVRVYFVRNPISNASMSVNGMLRIHSGLVLRAQNEAQLAAVIAHEIAHYRERHGLQRFRAERSKRAFLNSLGAALSVSIASVPVGPAHALAGGGGALVGAVALAVAQASQSAFSRDQEREADRLGLGMVARAGYDPREVPKFWRSTLDEHRAAKLSSASLLFATHPSDDEREGALAAQAEALAANGGERRSGRETFLAATLPLRGAFLEDELALRSSASTQVLLDQLIKGGVGLGELYFYQGELYRRRGTSDAVVSAIATYRKALEFPDAPPETHRAIGRLLARSGDGSGGRVALERYLELRPAADDREMVRAELQRLR